MVRIVWESGGSLMYCWRSRICIRLDVGIDRDPQGL